MIAAVQFAITGVAVGMAPVVATALVKLLVHVLFRSIVMRDAAHVSGMDKFLSTSGGILTSTTSRSDTDPADGLHIAWLHGPIFAVKDSSTYHSSYTIWVLRRQTGASLRARVAGVTTDLQVCYTSFLSETSKSRSCMRLRRLGTPWTWQTEAVKALLKGCRESIGLDGSMLLCGPPGIGKSCTAEMLGQHLLAEGLAPTVYPDVNLLAPGMKLDDVVFTPTIDSPAVLCLNEFDRFVDCAEGEQTGDALTMCLASSPTSLLATLDRLARSPSILVIATTNKTTREMLSGKYQRYTRRGRLNLHADVIGGDAENAVLRIVADPDGSSSRSEGGGASS